ncbi:MAG: hypothetical protein ACXAB4_04885 [Candidatus Hodarchaeales archaeon]|jgi:hypothetical protein
MPDGKYAKTLDLRALEARVVVLEERLGMVEIPSVEPVITLHELYGDDDAELLISGDLLTPEAVVVASDEQLLAIKGLGPAAVKRIRKAGKE